MNYLILVNAAKNYKYYYYNIAKELESRGHDVYFAVDSLRSTILEPLPEIDNSNRSFFFDTYLKRNFKENLLIDKNEHEYWGDIFYSDFDRFLTYKYNLNKPSNYWYNVKVCLENFFSEIIDDQNINCIIYENISNSFAYAAYRVGQTKKCQYIGLIGSRLPNHFEVQSSIIENQLKKIDSLLCTPLSQTEIKWFKEYKADILTIQPDYMNSNGLDNIKLSRFFNYEKLLKFFRWVSAERKYDHYYDYMFGSPLKASLRLIKYNVSRKINAKLASDYYVDNNKIESFKSKENFYIYPIHFHPESSTSVLAPEYTNELNNIINISNNLPFGILLYVKDHKSAVGIKNKDFYRKINALPNVRLIHPNYNIKKLILSSLGVITVNSTAGFEALILGKPVFIFGRVFYERFPNVIKLNNFREIRSIVSYIPEIDKNSIMHHVIAYKRFCYPGKLNTVSLKPREQNYYSGIVDVILKESNNN